MSRHSVSGHFIEGSKGPLFVLLRRPRGFAAGCVLVVPPFAEEMNKCRRMVTEVALGLADMGLATIVPDLYGTGDSGGDFADGDIATWLSDLGAASSWSVEEDLPVTGLLAVRLGCALVAAGLQAGKLPSVRKTALWQPVFDGSRFLGQFLRLRVAVGMMDDRKETLAGIRARLAGGETLEVAGYSLSSRLAADLDALTPLELLPPGLGVVTWLELAREAGAPLSPASARLIESTRRHGRSVHASAFPGEPFWSATEIVVNDAFVQTTLSHFAGSGETSGS